MNANSLDDAIKRWEGFAGDLHSRDNMDEYISNWKFTWRMRLAAGEIDDFVYMDGLTALEEVQKLWERSQQPAAASE